MQTAQESRKISEQWRRYSDDDIAHPLREMGEEIRWAAERGERSVSIPRFDYGMNKAIAKRLTAIGYSAHVVADSFQPRSKSNLIIMW